MGDQYDFSFGKKSPVHTFNNNRYATGAQPNLHFSTTQERIDRGEVKVQQPEDYGMYHYPTNASSSNGISSQGQESLEFNGDMFLGDGEIHRVDTPETLESETAAEGDYLPASLRMDDTRITNPPQSMYNSNRGGVEIQPGTDIRSTIDATPIDPRSLTSTPGSDSSSHYGGRNNMTQNTPPPNITSGSGPRRVSLYSAIGSLENASANSFGKIRKQAFTAREFPSERDLIPPKAFRPKKQHTEEKKQDGTPDRSNVTAKTEESASTGVDDADTGYPMRRGKSTGSLPIEVRTNQSRLEKPKRRRRKLKKVTIDPAAKAAAASKNPVEMFRPSSDAYTPRVGKKNIKYKPAEMRTPGMSDGMGSLSRPNFKDALRRVAMIIKQHVVKIEQRFENGGVDGLFRSCMMDSFNEDNFATPKYKCTMVRLPMARPGLVYGLKKVNTKHTIPTEQEIYEFGHQLFKSVQLSSECSIVCLIYVERLMEVAKVPLVASTWRPIFMCGLLLASKVWQDLSSWNIEFASVYPQFSLDAINKLELLFLKEIKWDLYISSSLYAKYYFALRAILEKKDFRRRYNHMLGVGGNSVDDALKVQQRSEQIKEEAVTLHLSRSM